MRLRTRLAACMAKLTSMVIRKLNKGNGATFSGYVAQRIDSKILAEFSGMVKEKTIVVMGTNGKTTTNSILCHVLANEGKTVVTNRTGANMKNGITAAFALATDWKGSLEAEYACIEVDENESVNVLPQLKPDYIILTNLSRDQLDRYGEVDIVRDRVRRAIASVPDAKVVLNCDDILSYTLSGEFENQVITFGVSEQMFDSSVAAGSRESIFCRSCGTELVYDFFHYGQLGIWHCPGCGMKRPEPAYAARDVAANDGAYAFCVNGTSLHTKARLPYNVYNTLSAFAALSEMGAAQKFAAAIETFDYGNNREDIFQIGGARVQLHLAKNPIGFQQKISLCMSDKTPKDVIIQINDTFQDGTDISWLWDVDFQYLADANAQTVFTAGTRRYDMQLRLKYDDIPSKSINDIVSAIKWAAKDGTGNLYVIVNYSGLYQLNHILNELQEAGISPETAG